MNYNSVALSGLPCSGKTSLCDELVLALRLDWQTHSIGGLFRERYKFWRGENLSRENIKFEEYWAKHVKDEDIREVNNEAGELLKKGKMILDSRYAAVNAKDINSTLLIFLTCSLETRINRSLLKYRDKSPDEICSILLEREQDECRRGQELYGNLFGGEYDYRDPEFYHLVLNTDAGKLSIDEEVKLILSALA